MTLLMRSLFASVGLILVLSLMPMMPPAHAADPPVTIYVPGDHSTIQAAIDVATDGDTVLVADDTYTGEGNKNLDFGGKAITVQSENGPENCIIDCEGEGRGFNFHSGEGEDSIVSGLTIRNGYVDEGSGNSGGGIRCYESSPTIVNCIVTGNTANHGGGIFADLSSSTVDNCTISGNTSTTTGGGVWSGMASYDPVLDVWGDSLTITNCVISGNTSPEGGGIFCDSSDPNISNTTISGNNATSAGGGIYVNASSLTITNSILWADTPDEIHLDAEFVVSVEYCDVQGGYAGTGNIDADPVFVGGGDYHLMPGSPCIDTGTNDASGLPDTDFEGDPRVLDGDNDSAATVDMGADECSAPIADAQEVATDENIPVAIVLTAWDPEGDPLTFDVVEQPTHGILSGVEPSLSYIPELEYNGPDSFTFMASDGVFDSNVATVTITVGPINDPPVAVANTYEVNEDEILDIAAPGVLDNDYDIDGDSIMALLVTDVDNGTLMLNPDGSFTYTPTGDFHGVDSFEYRDYDGYAFSNTASVAIIVNSINDPPTDISLSNDTIAENSSIGTVVGTLSTADADPRQNHYYYLVNGDGDADNDAFTIFSNELRTNAVFDYEAKNTYSIRVQSADTDNGIVEEQFTITVTDANDSPSDIGLSNDKVAENEPAGTVVGTFSATDQDPGDSYTFQLVSGSGYTDNDSFIIVDGELITNAVFDREAKWTCSILVQVDDGMGGTFEKLLTITITNVNEAPVAEDDKVNTDEDTAVAISVLENDTDPERERLSIESVTQGEHGAVDINGGKLTYTPVADFHGNDTFTYTISDGKGGSDTATVTVTVKSVDETVAPDDTVETQDAETDAQDNQGDSQDAEQDEDKVAEEAGSTPSASGLAAWVWVIVGTGVILLGAAVFLVMRRRGASA